jgi:multicomponent Na+:H+ antiporter subunit D
MLSLFLLLPLLGVILANLPATAARKAGLWYALILVVVQVLLVLFGADVLQGEGDYLGHFLSLQLAADDLSLVLLLSIGIVVFVSLMVAGQMITSDREMTHFTSLALVAMTGMNGIVLLTDLFSLYVFLEVTAIASFILIAARRTLASLEGAFTYLVMSAVATVLMLAALAILVMVAGETSFAGISSAITAAGGLSLVTAAVGLFVCGLLIKGGLVPFHGWLPGAYSTAPAPVSILLAGIITKVGGVYTLIRLATSVLGPSASLGAVLMIAGAISIVVGALAAMGQTDFRKMLAYSSISQVGYIVLALGCGTPLAIAGAVFHLFNHAVFKSLLFVNSAAVEEQLGTMDMGRMGGLGSKMPYTNATSLVAFLSTAGVPPLSGFWSKLMIIVALWQSGLYGYAFVAILASVLTLAYLLIMQRRIFFGILPQHLQTVREAGGGILVPEVMLAMIIVVVGLCFPLMFNTFILPVGSFLK